VSHLVVAISAHGFGHAAQIAPVIGELARCAPALRLTLVTEAPEMLLRGRIAAPFTYVAHAADFGLCMRSALEIDRATSIERYRTLHADWPASVEREARFLAALEPDYLLADVPYLSLAAAQRLGVPAFALCSLNWADVFQHYFGELPGAGRYVEQMQAAYNSAALFIRPEPAMPMDWLDNAVSVDAIARVGRPQPDRLREVLGLDAPGRVLMAAFGGIDLRPPVESWPTAPGDVWLVPDSWSADAPGLSPVGSVPMPFVDLLASVDCVLGKCGYGTVTECVANGTPFAYIPRPDWPEEPYLTDWLQRHRAGVAVESDDLARGVLGGILDRYGIAPVERTKTHGAAEACELLLQNMRLSGRVARK